MVEIETLLHINLFGQVRVRHNFDAGPMCLTGSLADLFAFLVLQRPRMVERDKLLSMFWGNCEPTRARSLMNTTLWGLRLILEPLPLARETFLLFPDSGEIGFNDASDFKLDVLDFEERVKPGLLKPPQALQHGDLQAIETALLLYEGDLTESCAYRWALYERERLRDLYLRALAHLMTYYETIGNYAHSIELARQYLRYDPFRMEIQQQIMRLYVKMGQRDQAVRHYEICCQALGYYLQPDQLSNLSTRRAVITHLPQGNTTNNLPDSYLLNASNLPDAALAHQQMMIAIQALREAQRQLDVAMRTLFDLDSEDRLARSGG